jgi:hypothetical protein
LVLESWEKVKSIRRMREEAAWWGLVGEMLEQRRAMIGEEVSFS